MTRRRLVALTRTILLAAIAAAAIPAASAAASAPTAPLAECAPTASPSQLAPGQAAVGFTVRRGETVERFDVTILGVMRDGLGPGRDMVVVDADAGAPVIAEGGISAGMSGSPVYTHDGRLVGAIGYAFALGSSPVGGVTPAPDMLRLLNEPPGAAAESGRSAAAEPGPSRIEVDGRLRRHARAAGVSPEALDAGLMRLPLPLSVSGLRPERAAALRQAATRRGLPFIVTGGGRPAPLATLGPTATVAPGDSFAAALSYGDVTFSAVGTTTYVCQGSVLAFGHPFLFSGPTLLGANRAWVFGIVDDALVPFKLASVGAPIGVVDRDRFAALRAEAGREIPTLPIVQNTFALDTGERRRGRTEVVRAPGDARLLFPDIAIAHAFGNIDSAFDQISGGSSLVTWMIRGERTRSGRPFKLRRANRFASNWDISLASVLELWGDLISLPAQTLAPIELEALRVDVRVEQAVRRFQIAGARWATRGKRFRRADVLQLRPGQRVRARVMLRDTQSSAVRNATLRLRSPRRPGSGSIRITGGARPGGGDLFFDDDGGGLDFFACTGGGKCAERAPRTRSFNRLLARLRSRPRNDELVGELRFRGNRRTTVRRVGRVVGGRAAVRIVVRRRR